MRQGSHILSVRTNGPGLVVITSPVSNWCGAQGIRDGLLTLFIRHTSASLTIQENADPDVLADLTDFFTRLAPPSTAYRHSAEGLDDMPAHIKAALTASHLSIPLIGGNLSLGAWQGIYVFEHRKQAHTRHVALHVMGN